MLFSHAHVLSILRTIPLWAALLALPTLAVEPMVAIVRTAPPYALEVEKALQARLDEWGIAYLPSILAESDLAQAQKTKDAVSQLVAEQQPAVVAAIGTQASVPVWPVLEPLAIPLVFSAVTFPVESRLIAAFDQPTGKAITGVGYTIPLQQRIRLVRELFPDPQRFNKLTFIYSSKVLQEFGLVTALKRLRQEAGFALSTLDVYDTALQRLSLDNLTSRLQETGAHVVFGWFSLDQLSANPQDAAILRAQTVPILAITSGFIDNGAVAAIVSDHHAIGQQQADMIKQILDGTPAGQIPPQQSTTYQIELNLKRATELGIEFPAAMVKQAVRVVR